MIIHIKEGPNEVAEYEDTPEALQQLMEDNTFSIQEVRNEDLTNGTLILTENTSVIGFGAFAGCSNLTHIKFPSSLKKISSTAFICCTSLSEITIPENVEELGFPAFQGCNNLRIINIPSKFVENFCGPDSWFRELRPSLERININGTDRDMVALKKKIVFTSDVLAILNRTDISEQAMKIQNEWLEKLSSIPQISSFYKRSAEWVEEFGGSEFDFSRLQDELKGHVNSFLDTRIDPTLVKYFDPSMDENYNPILVKARDEVAKIQLPSYEDDLVEYEAKVRNVVEYHMSIASDVIKYQHYMTDRNVFFAKAQAVGSSNISNITGKKRSSSTSIEDETNLKWERRRKENFICAPPTITRKFL